ncbi:hypothetical protein MNBD_GAMMA23-2460 [hydrothermal vent metagenome]|uniref:ER-bound oxygenase mpaB/mpaB'/Rubber oxygenase catalytic domain-containing protein n=1 Tax=hydrothermal vent metagenome TaxID=652676 RepID=A0A3B0ZLV6_9ZZZZ
MNEQIQVMQSPFTEQQLDDFRRKGDPLADEVIDAFDAQYGGSIQELSEKLQNMIRMPADDDLPAVILKAFPEDGTIRQALEKYFTQAVALPDWVDSDKLALGGKVFQDHLFTSFMALGCASLPICYVCRPDVKVLGFTRRLIDDAPKRLVETAQMVTDVMSTDGLKIEDGHLAGKGVQSILKIRLIHASVRHLLLNKEKILAAHAHADDIDPKNFLLAYVFDSLQDQCNWYGDSKPDAWNKKEDGIPINKEALAETLLTFSFLILRGLEKIGVHLDTRQQEAFLHSWNIAGYVLGVDQAFLKEFGTYASANAIYKQILKRRFGRTEDGILLERSLLEVFSDNGARLIPFGRILHVRRLARLITSKLISEECYTALGLKLSLYDKFVRLFVWAGVRAFGWFANHGWLRPIADYMFGRIAQSLWDWRADFPNKQTKQNHDKSGVCNPLVIPNHLIKTSHLSK